MTEAKVGPQPLWALQEGSELLSDFLVTDLKILGSHSPRDVQLDCSLVYVVLLLRVAVFVLEPIKVWATYSLGDQRKTAGVHGTRDELRLTREERAVQVPQVFRCQLGLS